MSVVAHFDVTIRDDVGLRGKYLINPDDADMVGGQLDIEKIVLLEMNEALLELASDTLKFGRIDIYCAPHALQGLEDQ